MEVPSKNQAAEMLRTALRVRRREEELYKNITSPFHRAHIAMLNDRIDQIENDLKKAPKPRRDRTDAPPLVMTTDEEQLMEIRNRCARKQLTSASRSVKSPAPGNVTSSPLPSVHAPRATPTPPPHASDADRSDAVVKPLTALSEKPWKMPKVDKDLIKDPYLRQQGLHRHNTHLMSTEMRQRFARQHFDKPSVDFDYTGFNLYS